MKKSFVFNTRHLLIAIQILVSIGWLIQLSFHQTWMCLPGINMLSWKTGYVLSILVSLTPLLFSLSLLRRNPALPITIINYCDIFILLSLLALSLFFWWYFSKGALYFPIHMYGDETFHSTRVELMAKDFHTWMNYIFVPKTPRPEFHAEYMFYPSLAYVPIALLASLFGDASSIADQRIALVIYYLAIIFSTYLLARIFIKSRGISALIAVLSASSALLLAYTTSFYIEISYVGPFIFSFCLLAWGINNHSKEIVITAVLVSSLGPIMRETAIGTTGGIILVAMLWQYYTVDSYTHLMPLKRKMIHALFATQYMVIGLLPFAAYYIAKSHYTDWDKTRTSLAFILQQDYPTLLQYSLLYLSPIALAALLFCLFQWKKIYSWDNTKRTSFYLMLAAITGILASLLTESIFIPGYMPWTRNYLFYYADFTVLIILFFTYFCRIKCNSLAFILLLLGIGINTFIDIQYLQNDDYFHESETVFDFRTINHYITKHREQFEHQTIYIAWPKGYPTYPIKLLPAFILLKSIAIVPEQSRFPEFEIVHKILPNNAHYLLFYYLKNESKPRAFHNGIPSASPPTSLELQGYKILINSVDSWSNGKNGVMLLEKK